MSATNKKSPRLSRNLPIILYMKFETYTMYRSSGSLALCIFNLFDFAYVRGFCVPESTTPVGRKNTKVSRKKQSEGNRSFMAIRVHLAHHTYNQSGINAETYDWSLGVVGGWYGIHIMCPFAIKIIQWFWGFPSKGGVVASLVQKYDKRHYAYEVAADNEES